MAYSERPNINFIRTERKPKTGFRLVTPFVRELVGDNYDPGDNIGLIALEPEYDPTNTSIRYRLVLYLTSDANEEIPDVFVFQKILPRNSVYASKPMREIYDELERRGAKMYIVTPIEYLSHRELGNGGGIHRQDPASYEKLRNDLMHTFANETGWPYEIAFIVDGVTTVAEVRAGTMNFQPMPAKGPENFREGWRRAGLISEPQIMSNGIIHQIPRNNGSVQVQTAA